MHKTVDGVSIDTKNAIKFYREEKKFGAFSNFSPHPVEIKGKRWPTTEHYFQVRRFETTFPFLGFFSDSIFSACFDLIALALKLGNEI